MAQNAHPEDVKAAVRKRVKTLSALAQTSGVPASTIRAALNRPIPKGSVVIAQCLGKTVHDLWPAWYDKNGVRIVSRRSEKISKHRERGHCQKGRAA